MKNFSFRKQILIRKSMAMPEVNTSTVEHRTELQILKSCCGKGLIFQFIENIF